MRIYILITADTANFSFYALKSKLLSFFEIQFSNFKLNSTENVQLVACTYKIMDRGAGGRGACASPSIFLKFLRVSKKKCLVPSPPSPNIESLMLFPPPPPPCQIFTAVPENAMNSFRLQKTLFELELEDGCFFKK